MKSKMSKPYEQTFRVNGQLKRYDGNSFVGFVVDYSVNGVYSKRVAISLGMYFKDRTMPMPGEWGKQTLPDEYIDLTQRRSNVINFREWAPPGWDEKVWFAVVNQNGGQNTSVTGHIFLSSQKQPSKTAQSTSRSASRASSDDILRTL